MVFVITVIQQFYIFFCAETLHDLFNFLFVASLAEIRNTFHYFVHIKTPAPQEKSFLKLLFVICDILYYFLVHQVGFGNVIIIGKRLVKILHGAHSICISCP